MNAKFYICDYCYQEYVPKRRNHQKYCCNSCRSKAYHIRQRNNKKDVAVISKTGNLPQNVNNATANNIETTSKHNQNETLSAAGIGNAAIGSLSADLLKHLFTNKENRPATLKELKELLNNKKRYYKVNNLPKRLDNTHPIFDTETGEILYVSLFDSIRLLNS